MTDRRPSPARAEELVSFEELRFFDCRVERAGPGEDGTIWVNLTDTGEEFSQVWFVALPGIRTQVLETALVAVQSNLLCQVGLSGTTDGSVIYRIHAIAQERR